MNLAQSARVAVSARRSTILRVKTGKGFLEEVTSVLEFRG
jgi:hypothetical protein